MTPAMIPKGTLCVFCPPSHTQKRTILSGHSRKTKRAPDAIAEVIFNDERYYQYNGANPIPNITGLFPVAESTEVRWNNSEYIAYCIKDTTEIAVPRNNQTFEVVAGDRVHAHVFGSGQIDIVGQRTKHKPSSTGLSAVFSLGIALTPYTHTQGHRDSGFLILTLDVDRMA